MNTQFGAWIAAAITALQITLNSVGMPAQQISNFLADPFNVSYTYQDSQLDQYFDQSNIQILPGNTVIDGVVYDDVWLSESAAEIFRVNAFDWTTAYSIASNTNGTFASGAANLDGNLFYNVDNKIRTQSIDLTTGNSGGFYYVAPYGGVDRFYNAFDDQEIAFTQYSPGQLTESYIEYRNNNFWIYYRSTGSWTSKNVYHPTGWDDNFIESPFDFDYVSGTIPANIPLSSDEGLLMHIPHHSGTSHLEQFIDDNPEFAEPGGVVIDPSIDPDINTKLDDLINIIAPLIPVIQASFDVAPVPVPPTPGETIADTDYSVLDTILQSIHNSIQAIPQAISSLGDRILQDIEEGPIRVFDKVLDIFRTIFAPIIALITSGLSIWSYVLNWLNTISSPFTFILSVLPSGVMIPIYAAIAGFLCISIFRRFGR